MASGLWPQSQPNHLLPFLQHTGLLVLTKALLYNPGSSPPVMMRRQAVYHPTTKHSNVWRWLSQFLMWHAEDSSTSSLPRWGVATGIQSLSTCTLSETSSSCELSHSQNIHHWKNQSHQHGLHLQASRLAGLPHWTI